MEHVKVLHLITHLGNGGALDNTLLTVKEHSRERYRVHLAAGALEAGSYYSDWRERAEDCADELFIFPELQRPVSLWRDRLALNRLETFMREQGYQIVHTHCAKAGLLGRIAARRAGVPIVLHTFHAFGWQVAHSFHNSSLQNRIAAVKKRIYVKAESYAASLSDALITVADMNKQEAISLNIAPQEKFTTIYSGVDFEHFTNYSIDRNKVYHKLGLDSKLPVVGMVGRLCTQKAPLDFVQAAKMILQQKPNVQFIIVGDGPLAPEVKKAISEEQRIRNIGYQDDIREIFSILDVFALSSLWEGLGRALTEAMMMALPIAVTAVGGMPELIEHGLTGLLSSPKDTTELAGNISWLLDHPDEARKMGENARNRVVPAFSIERMIEQIENLYDRLLLEKRECFSEWVANV